MIIQEWNSIKPVSFTLVASGDNTNDLNSTVTIVGTPKNLLMGYILLSR